MDFLKKAQDALNKQGSSSGGNTNTTTTGNTTNTNTNTAGTEDYGDKGLDFAEKKLGFSQSRETNEKITDGARDLFEKVTGKKIDSKVSDM
jgi:hypothetical protein